jgi:DNA-binding NarL/FixJ family response regulator
MSPPPHRDVGVLTVDDQASFRSAMHALIGATHGFRALGEVASAAEALAAADRVEPQLVLMDVRMPGTDGVEATRRLLCEHPDVVVVLISVDPAELAAAERDACGAVAVVPKQDLRPRLLTELWRVHGGHPRPRAASGRGAARRGRSARP